MNLNNKVLTQLPQKYGIGANKDKIVTNWKLTVGMELDLLYYGEIYKVKVIKYDKGRIWTDYNGYVYDKGIDVRALGYGKFGGILKLKTKEFKYEIGDIILDKKET